MKGSHPDLLDIPLTGDPMTHQQFERLKEQLKLLSPQQLKTLKSEISHQLEPSTHSLLNDDEMNVLAQLFR
ncbi:hypothetical protein [Vibrio methylphosphonaticus]|uniref:hypothetical protein n=1 Tax=Vibrio methylphosphonaticus TaxID=2946866 RepID=UPI00202A7AE6|nr:hypothetical protein [Vibrio methylphosphonaticus]MCL9776669.1 hypothetical protein [Vibrio methylphosphonaticus]